MNKQEIKEALIEVSENLAELSKCAAFISNGFHNGVDINELSSIVGKDVDTLNLIILDDYKYSINNNSISVGIDVVNDIFRRFIPSYKSAQIAGKAGIIIYDNPEINKILGYKEVSVMRRTDLFS